ncbi:hypothetical protein NMY22_g8774 [Coprinellus aureogranulatus]|nr:hypothetical protein NMY22_g8774 [Coprinellus aureogranulatus]
MQKSRSQSRWLEGALHSARLDFDGIHKPFAALCRYDLREEHLLKAEAVEVSVALSMLSPEFVFLDIAFPDSTKRKGRRVLSSRIAGTVNALQKGVASKSKAATSAKSIAIKVNAPNRQSSASKRKATLDTAPYPVKHQRRDQPAAVFTPTGQISTVSFDTLDLDFARKWCTIATQLTTAGGAIGFIKVPERTSLQDLLSEQLVLYDAVIIPDSTHPSTPFGPPCPRIPFTSSLWVPPHLYPTHLFHGILPSAAGYYHPFRIPKSGLCVRLTVMHGEEIFIVAQPPGDSDTSLQTRTTYTAVALRPGFSIYLAPGTHYARFTSKASQVEHEYFTLWTTMEKTLQAHLHFPPAEQFQLISTGTAEISYIIRQWNIFHHACTTSCVPQHIAPDLTSHNVVQGVVASCLLLKHLSKFYPPLPMILEQKTPFTLSYQSSLHLLEELMQPSATDLILDVRSLYHLKSDHVSTHICARCKWSLEGSPISWPTYHSTEIVTQIPAPVPPSNVRSTGGIFKLVNTVASFNSHSMRCGVTPTCAAKLNGTSMLNGPASPTIDRGYSPLTISKKQIYSSLSSGYTYFYSRRFLTPSAIARPTPTALQPPGETSAPSSPTPPTAIPTRLLLRTALPGDIDMRPPVPVSDSNDMAVQSPVSCSRRSGDLKRGKKSDLTLNYICPLYDDPTYLPPA